MMLELIPKVRQGYCCSQLLFLLLMQERALCPELFRALNGLCVGLGHSNGPCGLLTGGAALLGFLAGKGSDTEQARQELFPAVNEYATWFGEHCSHFGGTSCESVMQGLGARGTGGPNMLLCGDLLEECWGKLLDIMESYGLEVE